MSREQFLRSKGVDTTSVTAPTVRRQDVDVQGRRIGTTGGMSNGKTSTTRQQNTALRAEYDANMNRLTNGYQPDYGGRNPTFDQIMAAGVERNDEAADNFWAGRSGMDVYGIQYNNDPAFNPGLRDTPYPTLPNDNGGGGGGYYGGGGGMTQAAWDKYQKEYLAMIAGFSPTQVGPAPVDDLTPLVNTAVDADLAHVAAAYGGVVPMDANAYQTTSRATTPSAAMYGGGLMDGQGFDGASARQNQVRRQGELNADAYLWDEHWDAESARTGQFNSARNADVDTLGANAEALVEMQRASLLAAAGVKHQDQMDVYEQQRIAAENADKRRKEEAAMALLQQGLASGMDLSGLDLSAFMGGA